MTLEDRWINSRLERTIESVTDALDTYDFAHALARALLVLLLGALRLVSGDRQAATVGGDEDAAANLLYVLGGSSRSRTR